MNSKKDNVYNPLLNILVKDLLTRDKDLSVKDAIAKVELELSKEHR